MKVKLAVLWMLSAAAAWGCMVVFPETITDNPDQKLLQVPASYFDTELRLMFPAPESGFPAVNTTAEETAELAANDLRAALGEDGAVDEADRDILREFCEVRARMKPVSAPGYHSGALAAQDKTAAATVPGLPPEFELYLNGAGLWHGGRHDEAAAYWRALLNLPEADRKYRTVWAAYMLGRYNQIAGNPDEALACFHQTREAAANGFPDPCGLALASYGWEAKHYYARKDFVRAMDFYLKQYLTGFRGARESLYMTAQRALKEAALSDLAQDARARAVITACLLAENTRPEWVYDRDRFFWNQQLSGDVNAWLHALEQEGVPAQIGAARFAWMAYGHGDMEAAEKWLRLASTKNVIASWLSAKLALFDGETKQALKHYGSALLLAERSPHYSQYTPRISGELATLQLSKKEYAKALALLIDHYWEDAAYIAEQVMTIEELKTWVRNRLIGPPFYYQSDDPRLSNRKKLCYLLARRLIRAGDYSEAERYLPEDLKPTLALYRECLENGCDPARKKKVRAEQLWTAAWILRHKGLELAGTELEPDGAVWKGSFSYRCARPQSAMDKFRVAPVSSDEYQRVAAAHRQLEYSAKRFHYRYAAADLALEAARLLPNRSEEKAEILSVAGSWVKYRDPEFADPLFKTLATDCRWTRIGRKARKINWFPQETDRLDQDIFGTLPDIK